MDAVEIITSLIGSIGFPIVCCIYMWRYISVTMQKFTETMQQNTLMLEKLTNKIDDLEERKNE